MSPARSNALRRARRALGVLALLAAGGCASAGTLDKDVFVSEHFRVGHPGHGWTMVRNQRIGRNCLVGFRSPDGHADVRVREIALGRQERAIPLLVLATALFLNTGRARGIETKVDAIQRVDIGDHEALVFAGTRTDRALTRRLAQLYLRAGDRMFVLTYIAPPDEYNTLAPGYVRSLATFGVTLPPDPPELALPTPPPDS